MSASGHRARVHYATHACAMSHTRAQAMQPNTRARRYCCQRSYVWMLAIIAATHALTDSRKRNGMCMHASDVSRPRSRAMCIDERSHLRKTFTRVAKLSVRLYTCLRSRTNCRDAQTRRYKTKRKAQLTSCIYVANLMQLRRCEWRYVACAPPPQPFQG
jgi:hypothetical protein